MDGLMVERKEGREGGRKSEQERLLWEGDIWAEKQERGSYECSAGKVPERKNSKFFRHEQVWHVRRQPVRPECGGSGSGQWGQGQGWRWEHE